MAPVDIMLLLAVLVFALIGYRQGFVIGLLSLVGLMLGAFIATRLSQSMLSGGAQSPYSPMVGLFGAGTIAILCSTVLQDIGAAVMRKVTWHWGVMADRILGGVLSMVIALALAWIIAATIIAMPQLRDLRPYILDSKIMAKVNTLAPPSGKLLNVLASYDPFPAFDGPRIDVGAPDGKLPKDPQIRAASKSVVRIAGTACGYSVTGSGWVVKRGLVVTNAHVVAGQSDTRVQVRRGGSHDATLVWMDTVNDLALLRVDDLSLRALPMATSIARGTSAAILGYPENGPFTSRAARFSDTRTVSAQDIYGAGKYSRSVTSYRGTVKHGNSGGPVVDGSGQVVTTVFATTLGSGPAGGYGVPNDLVREALDEVGTHEVQSGSCVG